MIELKENGLIFSYDPAKNQILIHSEHSTNKVRINLENFLNFSKKIYKDYSVNSILKLRSDMPALEVKTESKSISESLKYW